jgi:hypothetical protein
VNNFVTFFGIRPQGDCDSSKLASQAGFLNLESAFPTRRSFKHCLVICAVYSAVRAFQPSRRKNVPSKHVWGH